MTCVSAVCAPAGLLLAAAAERCGGVRVRGRVGVRVRVRVRVRARVRVRVRPRRSAALG